jgi:hypothetical protein
MNPFFAGSDPRFLHPLIKRDNPGSPRLKLPYRELRVA